MGFIYKKVNLLSTKEKGKKSKYYYFLYNFLICLKLINLGLNYYNRFSLQLIKLS